MDMVGRVHRCVPRPARVTTTYRYRDPDKRRKQMREYMRRWRAGVGLESRGAIEKEPL